MIRLARLAQQVCDEVGLTLPQYRALSMAVGGRRRSYEIATYTEVSRPATAAVTAGLERLDLLHRTVAEDDRRGVYFTATEAGVEVVAEAERLMVERFGEGLGANLDVLRPLASPGVERALDARAAVDFGPVEIVRRPPEAPSAG